MTDLKNKKTAAVFPGYVIIFQDLKGSTNSVVMGFTQRKPGIRIEEWGTVFNTEVQQLASFYSINCYLATQVIQVNYQTLKAPQRVHDADNCYVEYFEMDQIDYDAIELIMSKVNEKTHSELSRDENTKSTIVRLARKYRVTNAYDMQSIMKMDKKDLISLLENKLSEIGSRYDSFSFADLSKDLLFKHTNELYVPEGGKEGEGRTKDKDKDKDKEKDKDNQKARMSNLSITLNSGGGSSSGGSGGGSSSSSSSSSTSGSIPSSPRNKSLSSSSSSSSSGGDDEIFIPDDDETIARSIAADLVLAKELEKEKEEKMKLELEKEEKIRKEKEEKHSQQPQSHAQQNSSNQTSLQSSSQSDDSVTITPLDFDELGNPVGVISF